MSSKSIILISTGQPSTNPRLVKEADILCLSGFKVTVLYCHYINWAEKEDRLLLQNAPWKHKLIGASPKRNLLYYIYTRLKFKTARILNKMIGNRWGLAERSQARAYSELLKAAKKLKADWYIGHNLGTLAVAVKAAKHHSAKSGFDFEDYHRGEHSELFSYEMKRVIFLENKYVQYLDYITAGSPLIAERITNDGLNEKTKIISVLNCFPLSQQPVFREKLDDDPTLQLFWFSQTIGTNRGLEIMIDTLIELEDPDIHLTLAGNCNPDFQTYLDTKAATIKDQIHFAGIISPADLPSFSSTFDVGLALELSEPENRDLCLTNKIFTYLLAGNAVILSETSMQKSFNSEFSIGLSYCEKKIEELIECLKKFKDKNVLENQRRYNYNLAISRFNWENESKNIIKNLQ